MKLADKMIIDLMSYVSGHAYDVIIPNYFFGWYEMDLFRLTKSGVLYEYEIKISRADFFNDFKKDEGKKHKQIAQKQGKANRFYFVVPENLIKPDECPDYAGLLYYKNGHFSNIKGSKMIHKGKPSENIYQQLCISLSFREKHFRGLTRFYKQRLKDAEKHIENMRTHLPEKHLLKFTSY